MVHCLSANCDAIYADGIQNNGILAIRSYGEEEF